MHTPEDEFDLQTVVDDLTEMERETRTMYQEVMNAHLDGTLPESEHSQIIEDSNEFLQYIESLFLIKIPITLQNFSVFEKFYKLATQIRMYLKKLSNKELR